MYKSREEVAKRFITEFSHTNEYTELINEIRLSDLAAVREWAKENTHLDTDAIDLNHLLSFITSCEAKLK
jgi:hypothetical protein